MIHLFTPSGWHGKIENYLMKRFSMRKWVLAIIIILSILLPLDARGQEPITLSSLQIQIWPEYDKPGVLVIYQLKLSATTPMPASVSIRIPTAAGEPNAVAVRQVDGSLYTMDYTRKVAGDWATISFTAPSPEVQIEYYDPELIKENDSRHFEYVWPGDYAVSELILQVQQPATATDMQISPSLGPGTTGNDNLTYYTQNIGAISAGQEINITIDYQKSDDTLSAENLPIQPSAPISQSGSQSLNVTTWLPWILGILGASLIIGGIIWFWQTGKQRPVTQNRRKRTRSGSSEREVKADTEEVGIYCSQCGKRASPGDQFCRSCGSPIRNK
jgi:hypothetical protein